MLDRPRLSRRKAPPWAVQRRVSDHPEGVLKLGTIKLDYVGERLSQHQIIYLQMCVTKAEKSSDWLLMRNLA